MSPNIGVQVYPPKLPLPIEPRPSRTMPQLTIRTQVIDTTTAGAYVFLPWHLMAAKDIDIGRIVRVGTSMGCPDHLIDWVGSISEPSTRELGVKRFERLYWLWRYLALAIVARYPDRCRRRLDQLDLVMAETLMDGNDEQTVRKLRHRSHH